MKRVVYLLGAGFSAPLGIPIMSEFIRKSHKLRREHSEFAYFDDVFKEIKTVQGTGNYFRGEPFNIEEILSILEMSRRLDEGTSFSLFERYICDVVKCCTPKIEPQDLKKVRGNWDSEFFSIGSGLVNSYGCFVASLLGLTLQGRNVDVETVVKQEIEVLQANPRETAYSVVTLNYDMVLDKILSVIKGQLVEYIAPNVIRYDGMKNLPDPLKIVKVHGSVEDQSIIPPTFNKGLYLTDLPVAWGEAFDALKRANEIRIIGYSLPNSDAYIQYILKGAIIQQQELEQVDIICWDPDGKVNQRYQTFVSYPNFHFYNRKTEEYLEIVRASLKVNSERLSRDIRRIVSFDHLEDAHKKFCAE